MTRTARVAAGRANRGRRGLTPIELMISLGIVGLIVATVLTVSLRGSRLVETTFGEGILDNKTERALGRVLAQVQGAATGTVDTDLSGPMGSDSIDFQRSEGWDGKQKLGPELIVEWELQDGELDNGVDDDGDGLVDEGVVVRRENPDTPDEIRVVLATGVAEFLEGEFPNLADDNGNGLIDERGLSFELDGNLLTIRLTIEKSTPQGVVARTLETSLLLRN
jgi:hypothetical protein